ncbi:MAG: hypothetical protein Q9160_008141, partial [Pyrenula sp. 1 TL-2023]
MARNVRYQSVLSLVSGVDEACSFLDSDPSLELPKLTRAPMLVSWYLFEDHWTIITQFAAPFAIANEVSGLITYSLLDGHALGRQSLSCVWILTFAIIRLLSEQLDPAFASLDPADILQNLDFAPSVNRLPTIQSKSNELARLNRYISSLEEIMDFVQMVKEMHFEEAKARHQTEEPFKTSVLHFSHPIIQVRANFEERRARSKLHHQSRLCQTFIQPFDNLVQLLISHSTLTLTSRLDQSRHLNEHFARIGTVIAAITGVVAPLSLITGYYGMNVREFTNDATVSLFEVWEIAAPVLLVAVGGVG